MKRYKLLKNLPTFEAGDEFVLRNNGNLYLDVADASKNTNHCAKEVCAYCKITLDNFPNILTDWFEEIPEHPKTVWDLEERGIYYNIDRSGDIYSYIWENDITDNNRRDIGNCFLTREEAEKELARRKAKVILGRDTKGFKPDWGDGVSKYYIYYDTKNDILDVDLVDSMLEGLIYFPTREDAEASIESHEEEWKIYLGVEE